MPTDWEERYRTQEMPWEKGAPSPGLVDFLHKRHALIRDGATVLVPGCGTGHDARAWGQNSTRVTGLDVAPSAVGIATEKTTAEGLTHVHFQLGDFLNDEPATTFDWIFEHTLYCAIDPPERDRYVDAVQRWLNPGGQFLAVHYLIPDEDGPPFGCDRAELIHRFSPHLTLLEEWVPPSYPNRQGLELMVLWKK